MSRQQFVMQVTRKKGEMLPEKRRDGRLASAPDDENGCHASTELFFERADILYDLANLIFR